MEEVLASLHRVGNLGHEVGQNILDYFFLAAGMEEEHIGPWMVSQLMGVSCLTELLSSSPSTSLLFLITLASPTVLTQRTREGGLSQELMIRVLHCFSNDEAKALLLAKQLKVSLNSLLEHPDISDVKKHLSQENVQAV